MDKIDVVFANGNRASLVAPPLGAGAAEILETLGITRPKALLINIGGAAELDPALAPQLVQIFSRAVARAAVECEALIVDGGTQAGVMALMGQGVADRGRRSPLLGVAPAGKVMYPGATETDQAADSAPLDPNHSHFVLVDTAQWGGETETLYALAEHLGKSAPVLSLLVNGGSITKDEVLRCVRHRWPVIVLAGSGRLADEIAQLWREKPAFIADPVLAEIIAEGDLHLCHLKHALTGLPRQIARALGGDAVLRLAWERFALYDANAIQQQTSFNRLQWWILGLGLFAAVLVVSFAQLKVFLPEIEEASLANPLHCQPGVSCWLLPLRYLIVLTPIVLSVVVAGANRFKGGNKWILLRGAAEALKREIYQYRARAGHYCDQSVAQQSREATLAQAVEAITGQWMRTDVNTSALRPYHGPIPPLNAAAADDDGVSVLTPDRYVAVRLVDQLAYYRRKTAKFDTLLQRLQWGIYIVGGLGTFLAAVGLELWVAVTTALATALTTYLGYQQVENVLVKYNQAATDLENVRTWWLALSPEEQGEPQHIDKLVEHTEKTLAGELTGWVQQMEDSLAKLREPTPAPEHATLAEDNLQTPTSQSAEEGHPATSD